MKLMRTSSKITYEVGINREINFSLHESCKELVLTRFFTDQEMESKRAEARKKGNKVAFIPPFVSQAINKRGSKVLYDRREHIINSLLKLSTGLPVSTSDTFIRLGDNNSNLYLNMDKESGLVHIRPYWWCRSEDCLKPHKRGVTTTIDEFYSCMVYIESLYKELED